jgi:hypothetical protein
MELWRSLQPHLQNLWAQARPFFESLGNFCSYSTVEMHSIGTEICSGYTGMVHIVGEPTAAQSTESLGSGHFLRV